MVTEETLRVVERISRKRDRQPVETLHLADADTIEPQTLCGREFDSRTMIPLSSWGKPDRVWCDECRRVSEAAHPRTLERRRQKQDDRYGRSDVESPGDSVQE